MSSTKFLENLADLAKKNVPDGVRTFLKNNGEELERLAQKAVDGKMLSPEEVRSFTRIYSEYATKAKMDRSRGLSADALNAEIRNDFFNGVLGHIARNNGEREALLMAITRRFTGNEADASVKLLSGKTILQSDYDAMRTVPQSGRKGLTPDEQALWDTVQANESALRQNARSMASSNDRAISTAADRARREARAAQEAAARQVDNAPSRVNGITVGEYNKYAKITEVKDAEAQFVNGDEFAKWLSVRNIVMQDGLVSAAKSQFRNIALAIAGGKIPVRDTFDGIRHLLKDPAISVLDETASILSTTPTVSPRAVLEKLNRMASSNFKNGERITENELSTLQNFMRHFDTNRPADQAIQQSIAPTTLPMATAAGGKPGLAMGMSALNSLSGYVSRSLVTEGVKPTARSIMSEFDSGIYPGLHSRLWLDRRAASVGLGVIEATLFGTLLTGGFALNYHFNPEGAGANPATWAYDAIVPNSPGVFATQHSLMERQYNKLTTLKDADKTFAEYTELLTGIKIPADNKTIDQETLFRIMGVLQKSPTGAKDSSNPMAAELIKRGLTPGRDILAYIASAATRAGIDVYAEAMKSGSTADKDSSGSVTDLIGTIRSKAETNSVKSAYAEFTESQAGTFGLNKKFADAIKKQTNVDLSAYVGEKMATADDKMLLSLLQAAIKIQQSPGPVDNNQRRLFGLTLALQKTLDPSFNPDASLSQKPEGQETQSYIATVVNKAYDRYVDSLRNSTDASKAFYQRVLGNNVPQDPLALEQAVLEKLKSPTFRASQDGKIMAMLILNMRADALLDPKGDIKLTGADFQDKIAAIEKSKTGAQVAQNTQIQTGVAAARASELADEALRAERAEEAKRRGLGQQMRDNGQQMTRKVDRATFERDLPELTDSSSPYRDFKDGAASAKLKSIFNSARSQEDFDREMERVFPNLPANAAAAARELAFRPQ